ncbi:hypothetical protein LR48_Vigan03g002200 [Vigna angularis]|uniref:Uncharacterized protein n=1 Tax=Phaseolus angularis TaxID=3914 RepID=A0A0L9U1J9_PHAAN|nr:hypothetical protein LR48_Vigan03g002200 [Vigna angularis]
MHILNIARLNDEVPLYVVHNTMEPDIIENIDWVDGDVNDEVHVVRQVEEGKGDGEVGREMEDGEGEVQPEVGTQMEEVQGHGDSEQVGRQMEEGEGEVQPDVEEEEV